MSHRRRRFKWVFLLSIGSLVLASREASAFWAANHESMNEAVATKAKLWRGFTVGTDGSGQAVPVLTLDDYFKRVLFLTNGNNERTRGVKFLPGAQDLPTDPPDVGTRRLAGESSNDVHGESWNGMGGPWEDGFFTSEEAASNGGLRATNHFHDPLDNTSPTMGGLTGFFNSGEPARHQGGAQGKWPLLGYGASAAAWAESNSKSGLVVSTYNAWNWDTALSEYKNFLGAAHHDESDPRSEMGLSNALRSIGQIQHLIEDSTQPDHARNVPHPGRGIEEYVRDQASGLIETTDPATWISFPLQSVETHGFRGIWDTDIYSNDPTAAWSNADDPAGLSEFTNSSFYGFNQFRGCVFTSIPDSPQAPFTPPTGGPQRDAYPWPELGSTGAGESGHYWTAFGGSYPLPFIARFDPSAGVACSVQGNTPLPTITKVNNTLDDAVLAAYTPELMKYMLGYAETPTKLLFQPVQAQFEMDSPTQIKLHIFNRGSGEDGVTWHMDKITIYPLSNSHTILTDPLNTVHEDSFDVDIGDETDIAPGGDWTSNAFAPSLDDLWLLNHAPYVSVAIEAHLGTTATTNIMIGAVIPSSFIDVEETALDQSSALNGPVALDNTACSQKDMACPGGVGAVGQAWNPYIQTASGTVTNIINKFDPMGQELKDSALDAVKVRSRIAGMALVIRDYQSPDFTNAVVPQKSKLMLSGTNGFHLHAVGNGAIWTRDAEATDEAESDDITFTAKLDYSEFGALAQLAANETYLVTWTQAGNFSIQKLLVWLPFGGSGPQQAADAFNSCTSTDAHSAFSRFTISGCDQSQPTNPHCGGITFGQSWAKFQQLSSAQFQSAGSDLTRRELADELFDEGLWNCTSIDGMAPAAPTVPLEDASQTTAQGNGTCPGPGTPPQITSSASFKRQWNEDGVIISGVLGQDQPSETINFH